MKPPKSILRKSSDMQKPIQCVKFTKAIARHTKTRNKNPSLGFFCPGEPHERSPNAPKFEDRSASTLKPEEREFVDSGASMHMISKEDLNDAELDTLTKLCDCRLESFAMETDTTSHSKRDSDTATREASVLSWFQACQVRPPDLHQLRKTPSRQEIDHPTYSSSSFARKGRSEWDRVPSSTCVK